MHDDHTFADTCATSATLLIRIRPDKAGRELAWAEFHRRYAPMITGFARRVGAKPHDVDDVVQDVMLGFYAASPKFSYDPNKGRFRSFLKVCTCRALAKRVGKNAKFRGVRIDEINPESMEVEQEWTKTWDDELLRRALDETHKQYSATEAMQRTYRAFELYVLKERSADDVANELGISRDSVHQAKHRVTEALRKIHESMREEEG